MILADGIDLPLVAGYGISVFVPLTLLVALVESLVFRLLLKVRMRTSFVPIVVANIWSTLAGLIVYPFQDVVLHGLGIRTYSDFAWYYLYGALALVVIYWALSIGVEGLLLARQKIREKLQLTRRQIWRGVIAANIGSYLFVGPLFYVSTRPTFGGCQFVPQASLVAGCDDRVYYIDPQGQFCRITASGNNPEVLAAGPVVSYVVSADQQVFVYSTKDQSLYASRSGESPVLISNMAIRPFLHWVAISPDDRRIAYLEEADDWWKIEREPSPLNIFDVRTKAGELRGQARPPLIWDSSDPTILYSAGVDGAAVAWMVNDGAIDRGTASESTSKSAALQRAGGGRCYGSEFWELKLNRRTDTQGDLKVYSSPYMGSHLIVSRGEQVIARFMDDYGLLDLSGGPSTASFLSAPGRLIFEAQGRLYVMDALSKRIAMLTPGYHHVLTTARFQLSIEPNQRGGPQ